jgi:hypothetical protein
VEDHTPLLLSHSWSYGNFESWFFVHGAAVMNEYKGPDLERGTGGRGPSSVSFAMPPEQPSSASSYADLQFLFGVQDPKMVPKPNRNRRKSTQGPDHAKHRRTRSGCFTCRSRRVKVRSIMYQDQTKTDAYSVMKTARFAKVRGLASKT